ncbi:hypothetical protein ASJ33_05545 [Dehalococcoides mccartyi]|uniref:dATP/dGTP diphosphohydrolase domain-containing protein n=1 Tax=Dehalococcoides mccartyi TaxID=61435 RepID=UPI0009094BCE|nr:dATP/dGTP diphosphohydrolase domain-containing protein [Dehalococcoides mccartyi]APH12652.1 hypothetical protein ASJ33_05545 [Dehalococcoides mccartyi]
MTEEFDHVQDSGERQSFQTGAVRDAQDHKGRYDLLPPYAIERLAKHFENGAVKYAARNWEKGIPLMRYIDSGMRHMYKLMDGQTDEDHAAAAMWNIACYIQTEKWIKDGILPKELDDRPVRIQWT